jgi:hypothetical protein
MKLRSSQIGTSIDGGLGPQNPVTRKMKPVLFITMPLQPVQRTPSLLGIASSLGAGFNFSTEKISELSKRLIHPVDSFNLNNTALNARENACIN